MQRVVRSEWRMTGRKRLHRFRLGRYRQLAMAQTETIQIAELRTLIRHRIQGAREQRFCYRAMCVLLIAHGHKPQEVADWLGEHVRTLERWRRRYAEKGADGLADDTSPGRPPRLARRAGVELERDLHRPPSAFGLSGSKWQGKTLQLHLKQRYDINFSLRQCQRLLKQHRQQQTSGGQSRVAYAAGTGNDLRVSD